MVGRQRHELERHRRRLDERPCIDELGFAAAAVDSRFHRGQLRHPPRQEFTSDTRAGARVEAGAGVARHELQRAVGQHLERTGHLDRRGSGPCGERRTQRGGLVDTGAGERGRHALRGATGHSGHRALDDDLAGVVGRAGVEVAGEHEIPERAILRDRVGGGHVAVEHRRARRQGRGVTTEESGSADAEVGEGIRGVGLVGRCLELGVHVRREQAVADDRRKGVGDVARHRRNGTGERRRLLHTARLAQHLRRCRGSGVEGPLRLLERPAELLVERRCSHLLGELRIEFRTSSPAVVVHLAVGGGVHRVLPTGELARERCVVDGATCEAERTPLGQLLGRDGGELCLEPCSEVSGRLGDDRQRFGELDAARDLDGLGVDGGGIVPVAREQVRLTEDQTSCDEPTEHHERRPGA